VAILEKIDNIFTNLWLGKSKLSTHSLTLSFFFVEVKNPAKKLLFVSQGELKPVSKLL